MEEWKDIQGYEGLYQVSNEGNVKSLGGKRYKVTRILDGYVQSTGYRVFNLWKDGKPKLLTVHRLVAEAFIPNPENKPCIDHINTIRTDNRVENLRWVTHRENNSNPITRNNMSLGRINSIYKPSRDEFGRFKKKEDGTVQQDNTEDT